MPVIQRLGGKKATFVEGDIRNEALMTEILHDHAIEAVIHFAGLKAVGESVAKPLEYYDNNVTGTLKLVSAMRAAGVKNFIFSSSATVYGDQPKIPYVESFPTGTPQSPYGKSKLMVEQILADLQKAQPDWSIALLRYFNPVGAHPSGDMGEDPQGIPNNLMPYIAQVAVGRRGYHWQYSVTTIRPKTAPACATPHPRDGPRRRSRRRHGKTGEQSWRTYLQPRRRRWQQRGGRGQRLQQSLR